MPRPIFYPFTPTGDGWFVASESDYGERLGLYTRGRAEGALAEKHIPLTAAEAAMEARPHEEPTLSMEERLPLYTALAAAIEKLTDREQWVITAMFYEGLSLRQVEAQLSLSKTQCARVRDSALAKLRDLLGAGLG